MAAPIPARAYYMISLLNVLRTLGGYAQSSLVYEWMEDQGIARATDLVALQNDGGSRFRKEVRFARKELFDAGMINNHGPGEWYLTATGKATFLTHTSANEIVRLNQRLRVLRNTQRENPIELRPLKRGSIIGPTTGPIPVSWSGLVARDALQSAVTYILRWGETDLWKVGHAIDVHKRLTQINRHIPTEVLGTSWSIVATQQWDNCVLARAMEQETFRLLHNSRSEGERLRCTKKLLLTAWKQACALVLAT